MAKKYNEDYDIRVAPEFSGQDSNLRTTSKSQKYFLIFLVVVIVGYVDYVENPVHILFP